MEVSWQITGVRRDAYAKMHPLVLESNKLGGERGHYLHPDAFGQPLEVGHHRRTACQVARATYYEAICPPGDPEGLGVTKQVGK